MSHFVRVARMLAATALFTAAATVALSSPASATSTGVLADNGNGSVIFTYSGDDLVVFAIPTGSSCVGSQLPDGLFFLVTSPAASDAERFPISPATITVGTTAFSLSGGAPAPFTVAAGQYTFCLQSVDAAQVPAVVTQLQQLTATLSLISPTTTTTTAAADPATPTFTG